MKSKDILDLVAAMAPAIDVHVDELIAPLRAQLKMLEQHNEGLRAETVLLQEHIKELQKIEVPKLPTAEEIAALVKVSKPEEIAALVVVPTAEDVAALIPKPKDGKDVDLEFVKMLVDEAVEKLPSAEPGKDADPAVIKAMVDEAVAAIPRIVQDGKDADPAVIKAVVDEAVKALPPAAPGKDADAAAIVAAVTEHVLKQLPTLIPKSLTHEEVDAAIEDYINEMPKETGITLDEVRTVATEIVSAIELPKPSVDVKAFEAFIKEQIGLLPKPKDGESVTVEQLAPLVAEQVNLKVAALPRAKDGVGMAGAVINRDGDLIITMTDGTNTNLGGVLGKDGMGPDDFEVLDLNDEIVFRLKSGDRKNEWIVRKPSIADHYKGVWAAGTHKRGALVTWGGSLWMAQRDTEVKPETKDNDDWKLVVKRGRDGKDFTPIGGK